MSFPDLLEDMRRRREEILAGGGAEKLAQRRAKGLMSARERLDALFDEIRAAKGGARSLDEFAAKLRDDLANTNDFEAQARDFCDRLALALQASVVVRQSPAAVADAYCASRIEARGARQYGAFPRSVDSEAIVRRAAPR